MNGFSWALVCQRVGVPGEGCHPNARQPSQVRGTRVVGRDPSDTPTEDFVPDFDEDLPDEGRPDPDASAESAESSDDPGPRGDVPGDVASGGAPPDADSDGTADWLAEPEPAVEHHPGPGQPSGDSQHGGVTDQSAAPAADPAGPVLRTGVPAVGVSGTAGNGGGVPGGSADWHRAALIALLVLCTAVAGVLTGYAVVRATAGWTVTWGGSDQVAVRPPAREPSPSSTRGRIDRPQRPWPTATASPTPSAAATPEPSRSVQPSRSPRPRTTPTPVTPAPSSPLPPTAAPTASGTGDANA
jgi:hypothetical protein